MISHKNMVQNIVSTFNQANPTDRYAYLGTPATPATPVCAICDKVEIHAHTYEEIEEATK